MPRAFMDAENGSMQTQRASPVFIVDDSPLIRTRLAEMVSAMSGMRLVGEAASAGEAIAGIKRTQPDSVLLDLNLMGRSGLDVLRAIRPHSPDVVFVVLTNHSEPQYRQACIEAGAAYFLDKTSELGCVSAVLAEIAATRH
jgi:two-component system, NarL family, response regulator DevR